MKLMSFLNREFDKKIKENALKIIQKFQLEIINLNRDLKIL
jgi:hypothetical protein